MELTNDATYREKPVADVVRSTGRSAASHRQAPLSSSLSPSWRPPYKSETAKLYASTNTPSTNEDISSNVKQPNRKQVKFPAPRTDPRKPADLKSILSDDSDFDLLRTDLRNETL